MNKILSVFFHLLIATIIFVGLTCLLPGASLTFHILGALLIVAVVILIMKFQKAAKRRVNSMAILLFFCLEGIIAGMLLNPGGGGVPPALKNAKLREYFDQLKTSAAIWSTSQQPNNYIGFDTNTDGKILTDKIKAISGDNYYSSVILKDDYCVKARLVDSVIDHWCIDSASGYSGTTTDQYCTTDKPYCVEPASTSDTGK